jgi:hypothetical protein
VVEAHRKFGCDLADPLGIGGAYRGRLVAQPQEELLVESGLAGGGRPESS